MLKKNFFEPKISIIMNCYNGEKYLKQSLKSIINQSYKNWELIFYDNKSNDNSIRILEGFKDKRIKLFLSKNFIKLYDARNAAINKASGKFISFLDTDDWWMKNKLKDQVQMIKENKKIKIIYSQFYFYDQKNKTKIIKPNKIEKGMIAKNMLKTYKIGILTVMVCRNIFKKYKFNKKYNIIGDFDFFLKLTLKYPFFAISKPLAYYRSHSNNYSKMKMSEYIKELEYWIKSNKKKFKKKNLSLFFTWWNLKKLQIKYYINFINFWGV
jgi:glycosyltransferase involved in cell wall biosynthesis